MKIFSKNNCDLKLWLSVIRSKGIGAKTFWQLYAKDPLFSQVQTINVDEEMRQHHDFGYSFCAGFEGSYPDKLRSLIDAPPVFSYAGDVSLLQQPCIAIVGARNASPGGRKLAFGIAHELGAMGFVVVSGMARGIDGAAHEGSLETGTIAVLASGVDVIYPPEHSKLYEQLRGVGGLDKAKGCIISEMPLGTAPAAPLFPRRNRIIAALCDGLVVIEAAAKSGTLITAMHALELGKDVFVVPGSPLDPRSRGGNALIKQGAILIESAADLLAHYEGTKPRLRQSLSELGHINSTIRSGNLASISEECFDLPKDVNQQKTKMSNQEDWFSCLGLEPITVEEIVDQNQTLSAPWLFSQIALLEMDGLIRRFPDGRIARVFK